MINDAQNELKKSRSKENGHTHTHVNINENRILIIKQRHLKYFTHEWQTRTWCEWKSRGSTIAISTNSHTNTGQWSSLRDFTLIRYLLPIHMLVHAKGIWMTRYIFNSRSRAGYSCHTVPMPLPSCSRMKTKRKVRKQKPTNWLHFIWTTFYATIFSESLFKTCVVQFFFHFTFTFTEWP